MSAFDRKAHWENAWLAKQAHEVSWYQEVPQISLSMIKNAGLDYDAPLIDVGGGASLLVDHLLQAGYRDITVLDISRAALEQARQRLGKLAHSVNWIEADERERYVEALHRGLRPGAQVIIAPFALDGPRKCSGLDIVQYDAEGLKSILGSNMHLLEQRVDEHQTPAGNTQTFGFFRFEGSKIEN